LNPPVPGRNPGDDPGLRVHRQRSVGSTPGDRDDDRVAVLIQRYGGERQHFSHLDGSNLGGGDPQLYHAALTFGEIAAAQHY
jgi:hypothetical protein